MMDEVRISTQAQPSILLVDDSFVLRDRLAQAFEERGFRVCVAGDGDEGLAVYRREKTDYAVLDLRMPGKSGLSLIGELKKIREDVKILILSGFGSISTAIDAIRLGATNFLPKPADADDILNAFARGGIDVPVDAEETKFRSPPWLKRNGSISTVSYRTAVETYRKRREDLAFIADPYKENFANAPPNLSHAYHPFPLLERRKGNAAPSCIAVAIMKDSPTSPPSSSPSHARSKPFAFLRRLPLCFRKPCSMPNR